MDTIYKCYRFTSRHSAYESHGNKSSAVAEMGDHLATIDMGQKVRGCCVSFRGGAGSPSNTMSPGLRPTFIPSGILIHPSGHNTPMLQTDRTTVP